MKFQLCAPTGRLWMSFLKGMRPRGPEESCCCPTLSSALVAILLTGQDVRGAAGLGFVLLLFLYINRDRPRLTFRRLQPDTR